MGETAETEELARHALLGDATFLPNYFENKAFISARIDEIEALNLAIGDASQKGMVFQTLPKHMRRRIMSHTIKRMPRKLREAHTRSLKSTGALSAVLKRPSRKYRRRPSNLLKEYNRRQKTNIWLETHIWHAKRFHMTKKWGYHLADRPNDKSYRACYRAAANHCLLQDLSFMNCIELLGPYSHLVATLKSHTSAECGLTFGAKCYKSGVREGNVMFFEKDKYPFGAIGKVDFLWRFNDLSEETDAKLWLWCHPAYFNQILEQIISSFDLQIVSSDGKQSKKKKEKRKEKLKLDTRNIPFTRVPTYTSSTGIVKLNLLKDTLNRFRLTGPLANAVLTSAFKIPEPSSSAEFEAFDWWSEYYSSEKKSAAYAAQKNFWALLASCTSPCQLPPHSAVSVTIVDPRLTLPQTRTKAVPDKTVTPHQMPVLTLDPLCSDSPLWDSAIRDKVTETKLSTAELGERRSKRVVPGILPGEAEVFPSSRIPILLIQRPGVQSSSKRIGFGGGWDIISPAGWGMALWVGLVFRGCRAGGLREAISLSREMGTPLFNEPDTEAGQISNESEKKANLDAYFRKPPAKRLNFILMGIPTPFDFQWSRLIDEWNSSSSLLPENPSSDGSFFVLRNRFYLDQLSSFLTRNVQKKKIEKQLKKLLILEPALSKCLVPINVLLNNGGKLDKYSLVCLPNESDFSGIKQTHSRKRMRDKCMIDKDIIESQHEDYHFDKRQSLRAEHQKLLKKLRRKRVIEYRKRREEQANCCLADLKIRKRKVRKPSPTLELVKDYNEKMRALWLPNEKSIQNSNSRVVMGFVTNGAFCFSESLSSGQAYVTFLSLLQLILLLDKCSVSRNVLLIRNYASTHYKFAAFSLAL
nr:PREDICTED: ribonucleases P/MRP protein subunit POP1 isoform X2 [Bemisia tabaci]